MKAIVQTKPGPPEVLQLREVETPTPQDNEVLIRVHAATVTAGDVMLRKLPAWLRLPMQLLFGLPRKTIPGHEFAGEIAEIGKDVDQFRVGDPVFGTTSGLKVGSYAEYLCLPSDGMLATKPVNLSYAEAAAIRVGGMTTLFFLNSETVQPGQKVLIYGASGSVGTYAVQLAKHFGAEVTGVSSGASFELVQSLGADHLIDYKKEDFTQNGETYDGIFDAVGKISQSHSKTSLKPNGFYHTVKSSTKEQIEKLRFLKERAEGRDLKPVIDRSYPLEQIAEAHRYVEKGHKKGNVVIKI